MILSCWFILMMLPDQYRNLSAIQDPHTGIKLFANRISGVLGLEYWYSGDWLF